MSAQMNLDWSRAQGEIGIRRAESRAERVCGPRFSERVCDYFIATLTLDGPMSGEDLVDRAIAAGFVPEDARAFGAAFKRLLKHGGYVMGYAQRRKGHGVLGAKVYGVAA